VSENGGVASDGVLGTPDANDVQTNGPQFACRVQVPYRARPPVYTGGRRDVLGRCCEPAAEEIPHGLRGRRGQRLLLVLLCNHEIPCSPVQIAQYGVP